MTNTSAVGNKKKSNDYKNQSTKEYKGNNNEINFFGDKSKGKSTGNNNEITLFGDDSGVISKGNDNTQTHYGNDGYMVLYGNDGTQTVKGGKGIFAYMEGDNGTQESKSKDGVSLETRGNNNTQRAMRGDNYLLSHGDDCIQETGSGNDTIKSFGGTISSGGGTDTVIVGTNAGDVKANLGSGNDRIEIKKGSNNIEIDGGDGEDTAKFTGNKDDYTFTKGKNGETIITHKTINQKTTLTNVENVEFGDCEKVQTSSVCDPVAANETARIYNDPWIKGGDGGRFEVKGEQGKSYDLLKDEGLQFTGKFDKPIGTRSDSTYVTETSTKCGNDVINYKAGEDPSLNGEKMKTNKEYKMEDESTAKWDGNKLVINTAEGYEITQKERGGRGKYIDAEVKTPDKGVNADGVMPSGMLGETFDEDNIARKADRGKKQGEGALDKNHSSNYEKELDQPNTIENRLEDVQNNFDKYDKNADGFLSADELTGKNAVLNQHLEGMKFANIDKGKAAWHGISKDDIEKTSYAVNNGQDIGDYSKGLEKQYEARQKAHDNYHANHDPDPITTTEKNWNAQNDPQGKHMSDQECIDTLKDNYDYARQAGDGIGLRKDHNSHIDRQDLQAILNDDNAPPELKRAARKMLSDQEFINKLDTAAGVGKQDGFINMIDLNAAEAKNWNAQNDPQGKHMSDQECIDTLKDNYDYARQAGDGIGLRKDHNSHIDRQDLQAILNDDNAPPELKRAARKMLSDQEFINKLDTAAGVGKQDGFINIIDLNAAEKTDAQHLETLKNNFNNIKGRDSRDNFIQRGDLQKVLDDPNASLELKATAKHYLANPDKFNSLESQGDGALDGKIGSGDIKKKQNGTGDNSYNQVNNTIENLLKMCGIKGKMLDQMMNILNNKDNYNQVHNHMDNKNNNFWERYNNLNNNEYQYTFNNY